MATVMFASRFRATPARARKAGMRPVRRTEPVRARESLVIVSFDAKPAELVNKRAFSTVEMTLGRVAAVRQSDSIGSGPFGAHAHERGRECKLAQPREQETT